MSLVIFAKPLLISRCLVFFVPPTALLVSAVIDLTLQILKGHLGMQAGGSLSGMSCIYQRLRHPLHTSSVSMGCCLLSVSHFNPR